jgi:hypothetical protein
MINIQDYIKLSPAAEEIRELYIESTEFSRRFASIYPQEQKAFLRHFIINNVPFAFRSSPILYEQIVQYLADKLEISFTDVRLIGSAKTGFSMSPPPEYGVTFGAHSDLDFSIIHEDLFFAVETEFSDWVDLFKQRRILPKNSAEEIYWYNNLESGARQIKMGFFDTHFLPNYEQFPTIKVINNSLALIKLNLDKVYNVKVKKVSARVYKDWSTFAARINLNTSYVVNKTRCNDK